MRKVQTFKQTLLYNNDGDKVIVPSGYSGHRHKQVVVPDYIGYFHQLVVHKCEEESYTYAIIENNKGVLATLDLNDFQFIINLEFRVVEYIGATHKTEDGRAYRYGEDGKARKWLKGAWMKLPNVTNFDLYSDKNKYIPI